MARAFFGTHGKALCICCIRPCGTVALFAHAVTFTAEIFVAHAVEILCCAYVTWQQKPFLAVLQAMLGHDVPHAVKRRQGWAFTSGKKKKCDPKRNEKNMSKKRKKGGAISPLTLIIRVLIVIIFIVAVVIAFNRVAEVIHNNEKKDDLEKKAVAYDVDEALALNL